MGKMDVLVDDLAQQVVACNCCCKLILRDYAVLGISGVGVTRTNTIVL